MRLFKGLTGNVLNFQIGRKTKREKNGANCAHDVKNVQRVKRGFFSSSQLLQVFLFVGITNRGTAAAWC